MFDLASIDTVAAADAGAVLELVHPTTGGKLGMSLTLAGTDSDAYRAAQRSLVNRSLAKRGAKVTAEKIDEDAIELLAACTLAWDVVEGGAKLEFKKENVKDLYRRYPWIREQASEFMGERANYLRD